MLEQPARAFEEWQSWEADLVREHYPRVGAVPLALLLQRGVSKIEGEAHSLGLSEGDPKPAFAAVSELLDAARVEAESATRSRRSFYVEPGASEAQAVIADIQALMRRLPTA